MKEINTYSRGVPLDALSLQTDICTLDQCRKLLETVDHHNICEDRTVGWKIKQLLSQELRLCQHHAQSKMRQQYLKPQWKKNERPKR